MPKHTVDLGIVSRIALGLPGVQENTTRLGTGWKVRGKLLACQAINKSAEPDSLMVRVSWEDRERLIASDPDTFYMTDHYLKYPSVLVRMSKISRASLGEVLKTAWQFVTVTKK